MKKTDHSIIYGLHTVHTVLTRAPERIRSLFVDQGRTDPRIQSILNAAQQVDIRVNLVDKDELNKHAGDVIHQGVVAYVVPLPVGDENELYDLIDSLTVPPFLLILDGVSDPHNLGACLRTADAAGVHAVIATKDRACGMTAAVRKVATGAAEVLPFIQVTNLARAIRVIKERNVWCVGLDMEGDKTLYQVDMKGPLAVVMGAEGAGLRQLTRDLMDFLAHLPMSGTVASLNVSVATGIALYEAVRQRHSR